MINTLRRPIYIWSLGLANMNSCYMILFISIRSTRRSTLDTGQAGQREPSEYELEEKIGQMGIDEEIREIKSAIRNLTGVLIKEDLNS